MEIELLVGQRHEGESHKAVQACNDWLRLGAGRTLPALLSKYTETNRVKPPTQSLQTLKDWSMRFGWASRAAEYDQGVEDRKNAERERTLREGLALDHKRVRKLSRLAQFLEEQVYHKNDKGAYTNVWVRDFKSVGSGDNAQLLPIVRFNAPLIEQYRKTLDDLAKETGGRVQKSDVTSGGERIAVAVVKMPIDEL